MKGGEKDENKKSDRKTMRKKDTKNQVRKKRTVGDAGSIINNISTLISIVIIVIVFYTFIQAIGDTRVATGVIGGLRTMFGDFINGNFENIKNVF